MTGDTIKGFAALLFADFDAWEADWKDDGDNRYHPDAYEMGRYDGFFEAVEIVKEHMASALQTVGRGK